MPTEFGAILRDGIVLSYMLFLRIGVPLLVIAFAGKWVRRRMAETDMREQRARMGAAYCWDIQVNEQTANAKLAAAAYPELPCWLAVQHSGGGVTQACYNCPRYALISDKLEGERVEVR